jgi:transcriptional regulator with XRE-family HTH domain
VARDSEWLEIVRIGLKKIQRERGLNQAQLGKLLGISGRQISKYLNMKEGVHISLLRHKCNAAAAKGISFAKYFGGAPNEEPGMQEAHAALLEFAKAEPARSDPKLYNYFEKYSQEGVRFFGDKKYKMMKKTIRFNRSDIELRIPAFVLSNAPHIKLDTNLDVTDKRDPSTIEDPYVSRMIAIDKLKCKDQPTRPALYNGRVYTMTDITDAKNVCTISGGVSDYYSFLKIHAAMELELLSELEGSSGLVVPNGSLSLPKRSLFLRGNKSERTRHMALSVSTLLVYRRSKCEGYKVMVRKRAEDVAVYKGLMSIIPGGMFQPDFDAKREWNIHHCVVKEYCEELFGMRTDNGGDVAARIYRKWPPAVDLKAALKSKRCKLIHSGVVLNLLHFDVDICCVLLVDDPDWFSEQEMNFDPNWEFVKRDALRNAEKSARSEYDLDSIESQFVEAIEKGGVSKSAWLVGRWASPSLAALWLGVEAVREHLRFTKDGTSLRPEISFDELQLPT